MGKRQIVIPATHRGLKEDLIPTFQSNYVFMNANEPVDEVEEGERREEGCVPETLLVARLT